MTALSEWQNFYVIAGSSAGALIGLQFVVMALVAGMPRRPDLAQAASVFTTPTIVHFSAVLLLACGMTAPWLGMAPAAIVWGLTGVAGAVYSLAIALRLRRQSAYKPFFEDWVFHVALPFTAYGVLIASGCAGMQGLRWALFSAAGASVALLLTGIHNAWDTVTYHVFVKQ
ncbi:MAG: hypothetical protein WCE75_17520 [Terracidiphilus sp.]